MCFIVFFDTTFCFLRFKFWSEGYFYSFFVRKFGVWYIILDFTCNFLVVYEEGIIQSYLKVCNILVSLGILLGVLYLMGIDSSSFNKIFYLVPIVCPRLLLYKQRQYLYWGYFAISFLYCYVEDERSILGMNILCLAGLLGFIF